MSWTAGGRAVVDVVGPSLRGRRRLLAELGLWSIVQAVPTFLSGRLIAGAIDDGFLAGRSGDGIIRLAVLAVAVVIGAAGSRQAFRRLAALVEPLRDDLVTRTVDGSLRDAVAHGRAGEAGGVARLTYHVEIAREAYANVLIVAQTFAVSTASALLGLLTLAPIALVLVVPPLLAALALFVAVLVKMAAWQRRSILASERIADTTAAVTAGLRDVAAFGAEDQVYEDVDAHVRDHAEASVRLARLTGVRAGTVAVGGVLPVVLLLLSGPWLVRRGVSTGAIVGCLAYLFQGIQPALQTLVRDLGNTALWLAVVSARIAEASPLRAEVKPPTEGGKRVPAAADLELRDVRFTYGPRADDVIRGLDLVVREGEHLAVVGPSGIGKSTLAGLVTGVLRPHAGTVLLGGVPLDELDPGQLTSSRVLIPQESYVFSGTLLENLIYHRPDATRAEVQEGIDALGIEPLVERIGGLDAEVDCASLSTGERQLVTLARAYVSSAPIVILDEASCHLDPATEARVERAFVRRPGTLIVIAHRMTSAYRAERVLVMGGAETAVGTHDELLVRSPLYRSLAGHWASAVRFDQPTSGIPSADRTARRSGRRAVHTR